jgi:pyruvate/2-oxoglutarate dehydrogenase complex dihydrolipoamide dehydrogenase (E3) component
MAVHTRSITIHPSGNPPSDLPTLEFDVVVIGAGSTGENVAGRARAGGLDVVVIEDQLVGGECSYWACIPSKALLRSPEAVGTARAVDGAKQAVTGDLDVPAVLARRDAFTGNWDDGGQVEWVEGQGISLVRGAARITGERVVTVTSRAGSTTELRARHAVAVCTGSEPAMPPIEGLADCRPWIPRDATSADQVPDSLVIVGGGVVGVEMATAWSAFGTKVTVLQRGDRLLRGYEPEAGRRVRAALENRAVTVRLGVEVSRVRRDGAKVHAETADGDSVIAAEILVATGRQARTRDIGLETVGLTPGGYLETDDSMRVDGHDWLYAAGDCTGRALLTHMGKYQARVCGDVIVARASGQPVRGDAWTRHSASADHRAVPQVVFSDPQVASVGLTEAQARDAGIAVRTADFDLGSIAGASLSADNASGWATLVVDTERDVLVGVTFVGPDVGELLHAATIAVVAEVPLSRLWHAVPSFPTTSEIWLRLLETYGL